MRVFSQPKPHECLYFEHDAIENPREKDGGPGSMQADTSCGFSCFDHPRVLARAVSYGMQVQQGTSCSACTTQHWKHTCVVTYPIVQVLVSVGYAGEQKPQGVSSRAHHGVLFASRSISSLVEFHFKLDCMALSIKKAVMRPLEASLELSRFDSGHGRPNQRRICFSSFFFLICSCDEKDFDWLD